VGILVLVLLSEFGDSRLVTQCGGSRIVTISCTRKGYLG